LSEDDTPVRSKIQQNSSGFSDFCIKDIRLKEFGRREIDFAEHGNIDKSFKKYYLYIFNLNFEIKNIYCFILCSVLMHILHTTDKYGK